MFRSRVVFLHCTHTIKIIIIFSINTKYQAHQSLSRNIIFYILIKLQNIQIIKYL